MDASVSWFLFSDYSRCFSQMIRGEPIRIAIQVHSHTAGGLSVGKNLLAALGRVGSRHEFLVSVPRGVGCESLWGRSRLCADYSCRWAVAAGSGGALAQSLGIAEQTRFLGQQPEPWPALKAADLFCLPRATRACPMCCPKPPHAVCRWWLRIYRK